MFYSKIMEPLCAIVSRVSLLGYYLYTRHVLFLGNILWVDNVAVVSNSLTCMFT